MNALRFLVVFAIGVFSLPAHTQNDGGPVMVSAPVTPVVINVDLRDLPQANSWQPGDPIRIIPEGIAGDGVVAADPLWQDPLVQRGSGVPVSFPVLTSFEGLGFTGVRPPDIVGDVGPNHYVQMVNFTQLQIWDKSGNVLAGPVELNTLWNGNPGSFCTGGLGDPIVVYDEMADRWLLQEFDPDANNLCVYISQGPNPVTDGWFVYDFMAPNFPDYPQYSAWLDAYYVTSFEGSVLGLYALDRDEMLQGNAATFQRFQVSALNGSSPRVTRILPADHDGPAPPAGSPNFLIRTVDDTQDASDPTDRIEIFEFVVDWDTPANSSVTLAQSVPVTDLTLLPCTGSPPRQCVPQPGSSQQLDALYNRALRRAQYRNFGTYESIVLNQVVDAGGDVAGKRWWELRRPLGARGPATWSIYQEGTFSPDTAGRFMGSVAQNGEGAIALAYSISSDTIFPGIRFTGRFADTTLGEMLGETTIFDGIGIQTSTSSRWGDYSSLNVDPTDDKTFWYTTQYMLANNSAWGTRIASFIIDDDIYIDSFE